MPYSSVSILSPCLKTRLAIAKSGCSQSMPIMARRTKPHSDVKKRKSLILDATCGFFMLALKSDADEGSSVSLRASRQTVRWIIASLPDDGSSLPTVKHWPRLQHCDRTHD